MKIIKIISYLLVFAIPIFFIKSVFLTKYAIVEKINNRNLKETVFGVGYVGAEVISDVATQINGKIYKINVIEGQEVKSGEVLVKIDDNELKYNLESAIINNQKTNANLDLFKSNISKTYKDIELAKSNCEKTKTIFEYNKKELERFGTLLTSNNTAQQTYDNKKMVFTVSEKEYNNSLTNLQMLEIERERQLILQKIAVLESEYSKSAMNVAQLKCDYTEVKSPFDGIVVKRLVEEGMAVNAGNSLIKIVKKGSYWVSAYIDVTQMQNVKIGQSAEIMLNRNPDKKYYGKVYRIEQEGDKITEELKVDITFQTMPENLYLDEKAEISIELANKNNVKSIRSRCIVNKNKETGVYVLDKDKALFKKFTTGIYDKKGFTEIIDGLNDSDTILFADDMGKISENEKVTLKSKE